MSEIVNRVSSSPLVTIDLEELYPKEPRVVFDLKPFLFQELMLREKEFRQSLKELNWEDYNGKWVAILCSADAIVPNWAFILVATHLKTRVAGFVIGSEEELEKVVVDSVIQKIDESSFLDRPIVIKGCSNLPNPLYAYGQLVSRVQPFAKSIMYGEPCSTVPLYKRPKN